MAENEKQDSQGKKAIYRVTQYSRRRFLKRMVITGAGVALASVSLASALNMNNNNIVSANNIQCVTINGNAPSV